MDKLKQFIASRKEEFDDVTLPEGHFERFECKLPSSRKRRPVWLYGFCGLAAACIAILLFVRLPVDTLTNDGENDVCEIEELQWYYTMQMNEVLACMDTLYRQDRAPGEGAVQLALATWRILNDNNRFEEQILPALPCSEDGLLAMNRHYGGSLESLRFMLEQMEHIVQSDNTIN
jgi:hypothetical protein